MRPKQDQEAQLKKAAEMYERHFLNEMVKSMRSTISHSEITKPTMGEKIYQGHLDQEYSKAWTGRGGIGLADLIVDQMKEKMGLTEAPQKAQGPLPLDQTKTFQLKETGSEPNKQEFKIQTKEKLPVSAMWDGKVINEFQHEGRSVVDLSFDNGIRARILGDGAFKAESKDFKAGQQILNAHLDNYFLQIYS